MCTSHATLGLVPRQQTTRTEYNYGDERTLIVYYVPEPMNSDLLLLGFLFVDFSEHVQCKRLTTELENNEGGKVGRRKMVLGCVGFLGDLRVQDDDMAGSGEMLNCVG
jgi:hypothetical protein